MTERPTDAYLLAWPMGWKRTPEASRERARFSTRGYRDVNYGNGTSHRWATRNEVSISEGTSRVLHELATMGF